MKPKEQKAVLDCEIYKATCYFICPKGKFDSKTRYGIPSIYTTIMDESTPVQTAAYEKVAELQVPAYTWRDVTNLFPTMDEEGYDALRKWLDEQGIVEDEIPSGN